jgi:hypothetical protein
VVAIEQQRHRLGGRFVILGGGDLFGWIQLFASGGIMVRTDFCFIGIYVTYIMHYTCNFGNSCSMVVVWQRCLFEGSGIWVSFIVWVPFSLAVARSVRRQCWRHLGGMIFGVAGAPLFFMR